MGVMILTIPTILTQQKTQRAQIMTLVKGRMGRTGTVIFLGTPRHQSTSASTKST